MADIAKRFPENPLLRPAHVHPSADGMQVICLLNPGVFRFDGKIWLIVRVAENTAAKEGMILVPIINEEGKTDIIEIPEKHKRTHHQQYDGQHACL